MSYEARAHSFIFNSILSQGRKTKTPDKMTNAELEEAFENHDCKENCAVCIEYLDRKGANYEN